MATTGETEWRDLAEVEGKTEDGCRERIVPGFSNPRIVACHEARYAFARPFAATANRALDAGCGAGYGTRVLAEAAGLAYGADLGETAVRYACRHFAGPNCHFLVADGCALPWRDESFDLVCAMELIEHVPDDERLLREFVRVLRPAGRLILSTPRRDPAQDAPAHTHHVREYSADELRDLLGRFFEVEELYVQTKPRSVWALVGRLLLRPLAALGGWSGALSRAYYRLSSPTAFEPATHAKGTEPYLVALCRKP